jgi:alanyl aminopeptidase
MAGKIVDRWKPEWGWRAEGVAARSRTMDADALVSARSIRQAIQSNDDILNAFDGITYQKGAAVLDMFETWLGEEPFRKGVLAYLRAHPFGNATSADFLSSVASATRNPAVPAAFSTFLDQPGVPTVTAELSCRDGVSRLLLLQKRFVPAGSPGAAAEKWQMPICVRVGETEASRVCSLLATERGAFPLSAPACPERAFANAGTSGYYRVNYKGDLLDKVAADAGRHLTPAERVSVLLDTAALARTGAVPLARALELATAFANDADRRVVEAAVSVAALQRDLFVTGELLPGYRGFIADVFGPRARALGFRSKAGDSDDAKLIRAIVVGLVAREADDAPLATEARTEALAWLKNRRAVEPEMVETVLSIAARQGDAALFSAFLAEARATKDRRDRARLLSAIGSFRDPAVESAKLAVSLSADFDGRESFVILRESARDRTTREGVWLFLKANFDALAARLPREAPASFPELAAGFSDEAHRADVEVFFKDRSTKFTGGPRRLAQALEEIRLRAAFREAQQESVAGFLAGHQGRSTVDLRPPGS